MRIAFHAPLKAPDWPVPSGDRTIARAIVASLQAVGHEVIVACRLRTFDGKGDRARQEALRERGERLARGLVERYRGPGVRRPDLWLTYHLYHKAPDHVGPLVCRELGLPYVVIEASHSPRQSEGPWREGNGLVAAALLQAALVVSLNRRDPPAIAALGVDAGRMRLLAVPADLNAFARAADERARHRAVIAARHGLAAEEPRLITAAMMRAGDKVASYQLLAEALDLLGERAWRLLVAGDGAARGEMEDMFVRHGRRVVFLGALGREALAEYLSAADLFVWPAINEAIGMAILEAQAAGLAAVVGDAGDVRSVCEDGVTARVVPIRDARAFARAVRDYLDAPGVLVGDGEAARERALRVHSLEAAGRQLDGWLREVVPDRRGEKR
ncbi:MAG: glycosyltransferase [Rhizobiales bacterium]|nr:glycosyltransferase [Hyphomicrobiales bacterium]